MKEYCNKHRKNNKEVINMRRRKSRLKRKCELMLKKVEMMLNGEIEFNEEYISQYKSEMEKLKKYIK